jgi:hypothetical protein
MDRRKFLGLMVGGVAASAAVRTFPFRVFSFPKNITLAALISGYRDPVEVAIYYGGPFGGEFTLIEQISLAEAKARYGYEWRPGNSKTQRNIYQISNHNLYCVPQGISTVTGLIP